MEGKITKSNIVNRLEGKIVFLYLYTKLTATLIKQEIMVMFIRWLDGQQLTCFKLLNMMILLFRKAKI